MKSKSIFFILPVISFVSRSQLEQHKFQEIMNDPNYTKEYNI